jgi:hypothetical protein
MGPVSSQTTRAITADPMTKGQPAGSNRIVQGPAVAMPADTETGFNLQAIPQEIKPGFAARGQEARKWVLAYSSAICSI